MRDKLSQYGAMMSLGLAALASSTNNKTKVEYDEDIQSYNREKAINTRAKLKEQAQRKTAKHLARKNK